MNKCLSGIHKFKPRYDEIPTDRELSATWILPQDLRELMITRIYVKDVCIKCGKEINR